MKQTHFSRYSLSVINNFRAIDAKQNVNVYIWSCLHLVSSYPRVVRELYLHWEWDRNSHMGHQPMWLTAMHSGPDTNVCPSVSQCTTKQSSLHAKHCIKLFKCVCVCVYGFNVWSHDKAHTEVTVCVCSVIILSIAMETCFYLICIWVY